MAGVSRETPASFAQPVSPPPEDEGQDDRPVPRAPRPRQAGSVPQANSLDAVERDPMLGVEGRLRALLSARGWPQRAADPLLRLLKLQATDPTASTTVREPAAALERHVADSLVALDLDLVREARTIADLGAGAGWPGLALAAALPDAQVVLVESAARHCRYLVRAVELMDLANVSVVHARAEAWPEGLEAHELVTARALAGMAVLCEYAAPLLAVGGHLVAWKTDLEAAEAAEERHAAGALGMELAEVVPVQPFEGALHRTLRVLHKTQPTPPGFPRRPGMAVKRPLGSR